MPNGFALDADACPAFGDELDAGMAVRRDAGALDVVMAR